MFSRYYCLQVFVFADTKKVRSSLKDYLLALLIIGVVILPLNRIVKKLKKIPQALLQNRTNSK